MGGKLTNKSRKGINCWEISLLVRKTVVKFSQIND